MDKITVDQNKGLNFCYSYFISFCLSFLPCTFFRFITIMISFFKNVKSDFTENYVLVHAYIHTTGEDVKRIVAVPGMFVTLQKAVLEVIVLLKRNSY